MLSDVKRSSKRPRTLRRLGSFRRRTGYNRFCFAIDHKASDAIVDDLWHGVGAEGHNRRAAGYRLDHHKSEGLGPGDREEQGARARKTSLFAGIVVDLDGEADLSAVICGSRVSVKYLRPARGTLTAAGDSHNYPMSFRATSRTSIARPNRTKNRDTWVAPALGDPW
jgi:hypothetical protein